MIAILSKRYPNSKLADNGCPVSFSFATGLYDAQSRSPRRKKVSLNRGVTQANLDELKVKVRIYESPSQNSHISRQRVAQTAFGYSATNISALRCTSISDTSCGGTCGFCARYYEGDSRLWDENVTKTNQTPSFPPCRKTSGGFFILFSFSRY